MLGDYEDCARSGRSVTRVVYGDKVRDFSSDIVANQCGKRFAEWDDCAPLV